MAKKLRCLIGRHRWVKRTPEGQVFGECRDCRERDWDRYQDLTGSGESTSAEKLGHIGMTNGPPAGGM